MRICTLKSTGKLIEMQSNATEGTLLQNAINAGYKKEDVEEKEVTEQQWAEVLASQPVPVKVKSDVEILDERLTTLTTALLDKGTISPVDIEKKGIR